MLQIRVLDIGLEPYTKHYFHSFILTIIYLASSSHLSEIRILSIRFSHDRISMLFGLLSRSSRNAGTVG